MFVIAFVFVIVFVFGSVFLLVGSYLLITLIKCQKGHKSLRVLSGSVFNNGQSLTYFLGDKVTYRAVWGQLKMGIFRAPKLQIPQILQPIASLMSLKIGH